MISRLNEALAQNGIEKERRKDILQDFAFDIGMFHDEGEITLTDGTSASERKYFPVVLFSDGRDFHFEADSFLFHECAHGNVENAIKAPLSQLVSLYYRHRSAD